MNEEQFEGLLKSALKRAEAAPGTDEAAAARVLARLRVLPQQKVSFWRLPGVLLDWQFAPAWPRMAALASCAVLGFAIGLSGIGRQSDGGNAPYSFISGSDVGSTVFDTDVPGDANP